MNKWQIEWGKLALILVLMMGGFALIFVALLGEVTDDRFTITVALGSSIITGCMGYLFGNGRLASRGEQSVPTIGPRDPGRIDTGSLLYLVVLFGLMVVALYGMGVLGSAIV